MYKPYYPEHYDQLTKTEKASLLGDGNNLYSIGGHATDYQQIGYSLRQIVKDFFSINEVPPHVVANLHELDRTTARMVMLVAKIVDEMCVDTIAQRDKRVAPTVPDVN
jgi:tagatose-1,6-bisphosphate aldolase non-catalytic subunit AgaZ/GatZ